MAAISGDLTAPGSVTLTKKVVENTAIIAVSGAAYGTMTFVIEGTIDGTNWFPIAAYDYATGLIVTGTIAPTDNAENCWVANAIGLSGVRARVTAIASGTATFTLSSASYLGQPVLAINNAAASGTGLVNITSASANALAVGPAGTTNPTLQVDASTGSAATGIRIKSAAAASGVAVSVISSGTNENMKIDGKGAGQLIFGTTSTGYTVMNRGSLSTPIIGVTKTAIATQNGTPSAAALLGGCLAHASVTGAGTLTLDTAANIDTQIAANGGAAAATGDSFSCSYNNTGTQTVTITTAAGLTLKGTAAVPTLKNALMQFVRTGAGAYDVYITLSA